MNKRFEELDSLRGLAAIAVILSHLALVLPSIYLIEKLKNTPLHIFWAGHEAVILFFILSGYVLSLPYLNNKTPKYKAFFTKRVCRIYLPYIVSISIGILCMGMFAHNKIPELSKWFNDIWANPVPLREIIDHIIMLGNFKSYAINNIIWSLVHEMRISIIFPIIMFIVIKLNWKTSIVVGLSCSLVYFLTWIISLKLFKYNITEYDTSYILTLHYVGFFILGSLLAKHKQHLHDAYVKITTIKRISFLVIGLLAYTYTWWFMPNVFYLHFSFINDWMIAIGCSVIILSSLNSTRLKILLLLRPIQFTGKISYSLYLFHMIILIVMINAFYGKMPINLILGISFILSFIIASVAYYIVEIPSIKLGKILTKKREINNTISIKGNEKQVV